MTIQAPVTEHLLITDPVFRLVDPPIRDRAEDAA